MACMQTSITCHIAIYDPGGTISIRAGSCSENSKPIKITDMVVKTVLTQKPERKY
jgi:hypothetical protein